VRDRLRPVNYCEEEGASCPLRSRLLKFCRRCIPASSYAKNISSSSICRPARSPGCAAFRARIERIAAEQLGITGDTAIRLAHVLKTTPEFWMSLQSRYEIETARQRIGDAVEKLPRLEAAA
jgi:hypothetical protein